MRTLTTLTDHPITDVRETLDAVRHTFTDVARQVTEGDVLDGASLGLAPFPIAGPVVVTRFTDLGDTVEVHVAERDGEEHWTPLVAVEPVTIFAVEPTADYARSEAE